MARRRRLGGRLLTPSTSAPRTPKHSANRSTPTSPTPPAPAARRHRRTASPVDRPRRDKSQTHAIREWALANGYEISTRGRIPADIEEAYHEAN
ncbi:MAG TPA: histone-like nucleoid-structuring protein Lsr2 [Mycobacterium sp.]